VIVIIISLKKIPLEYVKETLGCDYFKKTVASSRKDLVKET